MVTAIASNDQSQYSSLHWAALQGDVAEVDIALSDPNIAVDVRSTAPEQLGQTPLHWACVAGHVHVVTLLLSRGADPVIGDKLGYNALMHACMYGHITVVDVLLRDRPSFAADRDLEGHTPLHWTAHFGHVAATSYLLRVARVDPSPVDDSGATPLHRAARRGHETVCELLLSAGADPLVCDGGGIPAGLSGSGKRARAVLEDALAACESEKHWFPWKRRMIKVAPVSVFYLVFFWAYYHYVSFIRVRWPASFLHTIILHFMLLAATMSALVATLRSPGYLPRGSVDSFLQQIRASVAADDVERRLSPTNFCFSCLVPRLPRSKHRRDVDRCVVRFDHYCPFVDNNIGARNHHALIIHAGSVTVAILLYLYGSAQAFRVEAARGLSKGDVLETYWGFCVLLAILIILGVFTLSLFVSHVQLALVNHTTYSQMMSVKMNETRNQLDRGWQQNLRDFVAMSGPSIPAADSSDSCAV